MSGHSKWSTIKRQKGVTDAKRGAMFTKVAREVAVAARTGGGDPDANYRLRLAMEKARALNMPAENIKRAIDKATHGADTEQYEEITYEGYGPHGVGIIVECQSDNRNRTVSEIRNVFKTNGGNLGDTGAVAWMFERVALLEAKKAGVGDPEEDAIEVGANEVVKEEEGLYAFYASPSDLDSVSKALQARGFEIVKAELSFKTKEKTKITEEQKKEIYELLEALEDNDDSHRVHASL